jgi:hypothetical protein
MRQANFSNSRTENYLQQPFDVFIRDKLMILKKFPGLSRATTSGASLHFNSQPLQCVSMVNLPSRTDITTSRISLDLNPRFNALANA